MAQPTIDMQVYSKHQHRCWTIKFSSEAQVMTYVNSHRWETSNTYVTGIEDDSIDRLDPNGELFNYLFPVCEHGMDGNLCSGPNHFGEPTDDWAN